MAGQTRPPGRPGQSHDGVTAQAHLVARSFAVRTAAHLAHLQSRSYAEHVALGEFYDALIPAVDEFAEIFQAGGLIASYPAIPPVTTPPVEFLTDYHDWLKDNYGACCGADPALENVFDGLIGLTAKTVYKLKFLK